MWSIWVSVCDRVKTVYIAFNFRLPVDGDLKVQWKPLKLGGPDVWIFTIEVDPFVFFYFNLSLYSVRKRDREASLERFCVIIDKWVE